MEILFLTISHIAIYLLGLFTPRFFSSKDVVNPIKKIITPKAKIIDYENPLDKLEI